MKKLIGLAVTLIVIVVVFLAFVPKEERDHFNPFIRKADIYVQIDEEAVEDGHRHKYNLNGYTKDGEPAETAFSTANILRKDAFLKVTAKGSYVETWEEVQADDMPDAVQAKFN